LKGRAIATVVLGNSQWRIVQCHDRKMAIAVNAAGLGSYTEIDIPFNLKVAAVMRCANAFPSNDSFGRASKSPAFSR
jgi:hypothetical protein